MKRILSLTIVFLFFLAQTSRLSGQTNETISSGAYIINMGVTPQTDANAMLPYGLVYALTKDLYVPVKWSINPDKEADGVDFVYDSVEYKGGPFIITEDFRNSSVDSIITIWEGMGVVGVTTTSDITVPIATTINFVIQWTLDLQNGSIAESYLEDAGIPDSAYNWTLPENIQCCDDVFVMPHADPTWETHSNLLDWNDSYENGGCQGAIWAACHAVSALENLFDPADTTIQMNFLSEKIAGSPWVPDYADNSLILWGDHDDGTLPYTYEYPADPPMQFMGDMDDALTNGSEQIYIPHNQWSSHTTIAAYDPDHPEIGGSQEAAVLAYGQAFGDSTRGKVMYQAGHSHSGSDPDNIAAKRAMMNFSFWAASDKSIQVSSTVEIDSVITQGVPASASVDASGGTGSFTYIWSSSCDATFSNPDSSVTDFIATFPGTCTISCKIIDGCGRISYTKSVVQVVLNPCQPVEGKDYVDGTVYRDINSNDTLDVSDTVITTPVDIQVFVDADSNGVLNGTEGDSVIATTTITDGFYSFELTVPHGPDQFIADTVDSENDDASEADDGSVSRTASKFEFRSATPYNGMRFNGITVPRGSYISSAYIEFEASTTKTATTNLEISVQSSANAGWFGTSDYNVSVRYDTTLTVAWNDVENWTKNFKYNSPDITPLIESIVTRLNWNSGQSMLFMVRWVSGDQRVAKSFDAGIENAPILHITYSPPEYPVHYIVKVDETSLPCGAVFSGTNEKAISFTGPYQSYCGEDFGINANCTFAVDDVNVTLAGVPVSGCVLRNDFDPEEDSIFFSGYLEQSGSGLYIPSGATVTGIDTAGSPVANAGTLTFGSEGTYTYAPASGFAGEMNIEYEMYDDGIPIAKDTAVLTIKVSGSVNPNVLSNNSVLAINDYRASFGGPMGGNIMANDLDPETDNILLQSYVYDSDGDGIPEQSTSTFAQPLVIGGIDQFGDPVANAGTFQLNSDGTYTYTPAADFAGRVMVDYTICDDFGLGFTSCSSARLMLEIVKDEDELSNDPPFAGDDYAATLVNLPVTGQWLINDGDNNGDSIKVNGESLNVDPANPGSGTVIGTYTTNEGGDLIMYDDGTYEYTPPLDFYGTDQLPYKICDVTASPECDSATIYLLVSPMYFDYSDLPAQYPSTGHLVALMDNGDYIPNKYGSFWLGQFVDAENGSQPSSEADGDNASEANDEQGLIIPLFNQWYDQSDKTNLKVVVNGTEAGTEVFFGLWIDWEFDGVFEDFYCGSGTLGGPGQRTASSDTIEVWVSHPDTVSLDMAGFRLRAFSSLPDSTQFEGRAINGEVEDYFMRSSELLPVELTYFDAKVEGRDACLAWQTVSEVNNHYFSIQKSENGTNWEEIGTVQGHGTTNEVNDYRGRELDLSPGLYYYRLQQFDFDGTYEFSEIRSVRIEGEPNSIGAEFQIYPNPARVTQSITIEGLPDEPSTIKLYSMNGKQLYSAQIRAGEQLDLSKIYLQSGTFLIEAVKDSKILGYQLLVVE